MKSHNKNNEPYNPRLKALILEVVNNQINSNDPPITKQTLKRLISCGNSEQQAKEKISSVVISHVYYGVRDEKPFDIDLFTKELNALK